MKITFILKGDFEGLPPMLPRLIATAKKGIQARLICTKMKKSSRDCLESANVVCKETLHADKFLGKSNRIMDWSGFRRVCRQYLQNDFADSDLLYICSADTALCLNALLDKYQYILQSNELYDQLPMYRNGLKKYAQKAMAFVVPELCRANICMCWYNLKKAPYVIPNIPYNISLQRNQQVSDDNARRILETLSNKKILIYQGHIQTGDRSLTSVAEALRKLNNSEYVLLLMGRNHSNSYERLKEIYPETYYISFIPAPYHLEVTSHAYIALLSYDRVSLNNLFCAPNKIFEYSGLGIPMLGNDIPGLIYTIEHEKMGVCASYNDVDQVVTAINKIEKNHEEYAENAKAFFATNDLSEMIDDLLKDVLGEDCFEQ